MSYVRHHRTRGSIGSRLVWGVVTEVALPRDSFRPPLAGGPDGVWGGPVSSDVGQHMAASDPLGQRSEWPAMRVGAVPGVWPLGAHDEHLLGKFERAHTARARVGKNSDEAKMHDETRVIDK
jgi:hypothetical protein